MTDRFYRYNLDGTIDALSGFDIEEYIRGLQWTSDTPDETITLVAGNLRRLYVALAERNERAWMETAGRPMLPWRCSRCGNTYALPYAPHISQCCAVYLDDAHQPRRCGGTLQRFYWTQG
jgi:hypothetical protein